MTPSEASSLDAVHSDLRARPRAWLVTGAAGFIGSHLVERLLELGQRVRGLDDFSTGSRARLAALEQSLGSEHWRAFELVEGDVRDARVASEACRGVELVLHQAALGSIPRSLAEPERTLSVNAGGTWTLCAAARERGVARLVLASSSSVYGDSTALPHAEAVLGTPGSPYAASKRAAELVLEGFQRGLGLSCAALRYFNVFGPRQDPDGPYAAVIPRWCAALAAGERPLVNGAGAQSRDFTPVEDAVAANLLAALAPRAAGAFNVGTGRRTSLLELLALLKRSFARAGLDRGELAARHGPPRPGERDASEADLARSRAELGFEPSGSLEAALERTVAAFLAERASAPGRLSRVESTPSAS